MADIEQYEEAMLENAEICVYCGEPCGPDDVDNDGNPIHQDCIADREAARTDRAHDIYQENPEYWKKVIAQRRYGEGNIHKN